MPMVTCKNPRCNKGHKGARKQFNARQADLNRGWGLYCDKSCKAQHQEQSTGQYRRIMRVGKENTNFGHMRKKPRNRNGKRYYNSNKSNRYGRGLPLW